MKLYTEEQVRQIYSKAYESGDSQFGESFDVDIEELSITPIELPSEEEISEKLAFHAHGARWVINRIKQQIKQQGND